jgi:hypothetical protein
VARALHRGGIIPCGGAVKDGKRPGAAGWAIAGAEIVRGPARLDEAPVGVGLGIVSGADAKTAPTCPRFSAGDCLQEVPYGAVWRARSKLHGCGKYTRGDSRR